MSKRSSGGGGVGKFWAIVLTLILIVGVVLGGVYRKQVAVMWGDLTRYFKRVDDEVPKDDGTDDEANEGTESASVKDGSFEAEEVSASGVSLAMTPLLASEYEENGVSAQAESAITITATVSPDYATNKTLIWELSFIEPMTEEGAAWFTTWDTLGYTMSDLVSVTVSEDTLSASVACMDAFGAQMQLKIYSQADTSVYAIVLLDYEIRITSASVRSVSSVGNSTLVYEMSSGSYNTADTQPLQEDHTSNTRSYYLDLTTSAGSYAKPTYFTVHVSSNLVAYLRAEGLTLASDYQSGKSVYSFENQSLNTLYVGLYFLDTTVHENTTGDWDGYSEEVMTAYKKAVNACLADGCMDICYFKFSYGVSFAAPEQVYVVALGSDGAVFEIAPTDITTDEDQVIF